MFVDANNWLAEIRRKHSNFDFYSCENVLDIVKIILKSADKDLLSSIILKIYSLNHLKFSIYVKN